MNYFGYNLYIIIIPCIILIVQCILDYTFNLTTGIYVVDGNNYVSSSEVVENWKIQRENVIVIAIKSPCYNYIIIGKPEMMLDLVKTHSLFNTSLFNTIPYTTSSESWS